MATFTEDDIIGQMTQLYINMVLTDGLQIDEDKIREYGKLHVGS
ncbi:hypothetical protein PC129_g21542 [Phytophthora cactorum]|uniref:Uncharacterized protein n=1 Tax=Phytophthora cactorum TaxID=29920 RepID=A0A329RWI1_9STRA|nr:hypothetical protein Pcac1_g22774 [Phytophthora cactorum]KAG2805424.1 hypothetical protein PC111_g17812 [Phytophthora cactorum]KAG2819599.1 hypothetical protein PC112_g12125 [Phytophthora cactorum]KAG2846883.1 hypothetical protein PC113_g17880 [Phytophthora cactorum]KAG2875582.1 hypothetical protein PC114_g24638 [Phytophthora cactorum]